MADHIHFQLSSPTTYFWYRETLDIAPHADAGGELNWWVVVCLIVAWIMVFLCMIKGIASSGKVSSHYENMPMQYTAVFHSCKNANFQWIFFLYFSYFCSKHKAWVHVRTASVRRF